MPTDDETLKRDKFLLDLMIHAYDEDVARNELIDSKNSQMIVLTGVMLSLNATLFTEVLVNQILSVSSVGFLFKLVSSVVLIVSIVLYFYSMTIFV